MIRGFALAAASHYLQKLILAKKYKYKNSHNSDILFLTVLTELRVYHMFI